MGEAARRLGRSFLAVIFIGSSFHSYAQDVFTVSPVLQNRLQMETHRGFLLLENPEEDWQSNYAVVSNFDGDILESQVIPGAQSLESAAAFIDQNLVRHDYKGVEIRELVIPLSDAGKTSLFWVGHRAYASEAEARSCIDGAVARGVSEQALAAQAAGEPVAEPPAPAEEEAPAGPPSEYPLQIDQKIQNVEIPGTSLVTEKDRFYYQVFGEFSYRRTNFDFPRLDETDYFDTVLGFATHRFVMKGIRLYDGGPSLDPFAGATFSLASRDEPFDNKLELFIGLEYRPLEGLDFLKKNPYLEWLQRLDLFTQYLDISAFKGNFTGPTYDWFNGVSLYKDWGWGQPFDEQEHTKIADYLWGELFTQGGWRQTSYTRDDFEQFGFEIAGWFGVKFPWIGDIPPLMPYGKLEFTSNEENDFFRNRFLYFGGVRYMPFHTRRFLPFEWLYGLKLFAEVGKAEYYDEKPPDDRPDWDFRAGIKIDLNRF